MVEIEDLVRICIALRVFVPMAEANGIRFHPVEMPISLVVKMVIVLGVPARVVGLDEFRDGAELKLARVLAQPWRGSSAPLPEQPP